mmetsp:Transcript_19794/g.39594  ORF Transcript_19794/g.39594 Transcript_19794/m.39594 type:complete len:830 (+) Transcript_19794:198-2687(+)
MNITNRIPSLRVSWKVFFAVAAFVEVLYVTMLMRQKSGTIKESKYDEVCPSLIIEEEEEFSVNYTFIDWAVDSIVKTTIVRSGRTADLTLFFWIGPCFVGLCLVEAVIRAFEARKMALHNRALDDLENKLLNAARQSTQRLSMMGTWSSMKGVFGAEERKVTKIAKVLRSWVPAIATIAFWIFILPTDIADFQYRCGSSYFHDSAMVTSWIQKTTLQVKEVVNAFHEFLGSVFWTQILPYRIHKEPQRFIQRVQVILRWIRFLRFAFPLFRMGIKLQDQVRSVFKTRRQRWTSDMARQLRLDRPSMIFSDIQKLQSLAKVQTALARIPSTFTLGQNSPMRTFTNTVVEQYNEKRLFGKKISKQLAKLQKDYLNFGATTELCDRITKVTQDITDKLKSEKGRRYHRYLASPRSLLQSTEYLISPRTRFSIAWRITVTNCLMLEIFRLCASWHLSESFSIPLSQIVGRLLVECKAPEQTNNHLAFIMDQINQFRRHIYDTIPILGTPPLDIAVCIPSGPQALFILYVGRMLEIFVDGVVFLDIFVWFFTGDIDVDTHAIIPKPFFTRCIIPGTLVQILDHPTLPDLLPGLLKSTIQLSSSIGYSRCIRWILALMPAMKIVMVDPMIGFFFEHIKEDEEDFFIHYAESMGMISPERRSGHFSEASFGRMGSSKRHFHRLRSDSYSTSQVGLSLFDDSGIQSMTSTESSGSFTAVIPMQSPSRKNSTGLVAVPTQPPPPAPPGPATPSLQYSPSRKNRSVHFGLHDESSQSQTTQTTGPLFPTLMDNRKNGDYSLSYSENSLQALDNNRNNHVTMVDEDKNLLSNRRLDFPTR